MELGYDGGDGTITKTPLDDLGAGGGFKVAVGWQQYIGGFDDVGLIFSLGYLFNEIEASIGEEETRAVVAEALYFREFGPYRLSVGGSYHMNPRYTASIDGLAPTRIEFNDALGLVGRCGYVIDKTFEIGLRYTFIDYEANGDSYNADSLGFYVSSVF